MAFDVIHQEADGNQADHKSNHTAHHENGHFGTGHGSAGEDEFDHLEQGGTGHDRDGEEERELGHAGTGEAQQQAAHDGGTGAGGAGDDGQHLPHAHEKGFPVGDLLQTGDMGRGAAVFHQNKEHAVQDQHGGHGDVIVEAGLHPVVQRADDQHGQGGNDDFEPQLPDLGFGDHPAMLEAKGPQFMPEQHHHGQDGPQLDDHPEHGQELFAGVELDDLLHKDHMARGRDGQPLGNALHNAH